MEPKKEIKNHYLIKPKSKWLEPLRQEELISRINEISEQIHRSGRIGPTNFMVMGPHATEQLDELMIEYRNTIPLDVIIEPRRPAENISITFTADTWTQDET